MNKDIKLSLSGTIFGNAEEYGEQINEIICRYLYVVSNQSKQRWRAINKITKELYGSLNDKEMVRMNLNTLVKHGLIITRPSDLSNDSPQTVKYCISEKGREFINTVKK